MVLLVNAAHLVDSLILNCHHAIKSNKMSMPVHSFDASFMNHYQFDFRWPMARY